MIGVDDLYNNWSVGVLWGRLDSDESAIVDPDLLTGGEGKSTPGEHGAGVVGADGWVSKPFRHVYLNYPDEIVGGGIKQ